MQRPAYGQVTGIRRCTGAKNSHSIWSAGYEPKPFDIQLRSLTHNYVLTGGFGHKRRHRQPEDGLAGLNYVEQVTGKAGPSLKACRRRLNLLQ